MELSAQVYIAIGVIVNILCTILFNTILCLTWLV